MLKLAPACRKGPYLIYERGRCIEACENAQARQAIYCL